MKALWQAAEVSKTGNADRLKEGVDELRPDYNLMMFSAICNAVQTVTGCEHITYPRVNEIMGIEYWTGKKKIGENLSMAGGNPYDVWYDLEKQLMEEENRKKRRRSKLQDKL